MSTEWQVTTANSALDFVTDGATTYHSAVLLDENHAIDFWIKSSDAFCQVFEVNTTTWAVTTAGAVFNYDTVASAWCEAVKIDDNHVIAFTSRGALDGFADVFEINTTTWAVTTVGSLEFMNNDVRWHGACQMDTNHFLNVWVSLAPNDGTQAQIFTVNTSTWAVTTANSNLQIDTTTNGGDSFCLKIDDTHALAVYGGEGNDGFAEVLAINTSTWAISTTATRLEFDTAQGSGICARQVDDNHYVVFYAGFSSDGNAIVLEVNTSTWAVTTANDANEFDTSNGDDHSTWEIDSNVFLDFWSGSSSDGFAQVFRINTDAWWVFHGGSALEFDTTNGNYHSSVQIDTSHYVDFWGTSVTNPGGRAQAFEITAPSDSPYTKQGRPPYVFTDTPTSNWAYLEQSANRSIARDSNGYLYCVYNAYNGTSHYTVRIARSTDNGRTWDRAELVDLGDYGYTPKIAIDSTDKIWVVWEGYGGTGDSSNYKNIFYINGTWGSWNSHVQLTATDGGIEQFVAGIAIDGNDDVHMVWYGEKPEHPANTYQIRYIKVLNDGTLGDIIDLTNDSNVSQYDPVVGVDSNNNVYVVWWNQNAEIWLRKFTYETGSWGDIKVWDTYGTMGFPDFVFDGHDNVCILYFAGGSDDQYRFITYNAITDTFTGDELVFDSGNISYSQYSSLSIDKEGNMYAVMSAGDPLQIYVNSRISGSWGTTQRMTYTDDFQQRPTLMGAIWPRNNGQPNIPDKGFVGIWNDGNGTGGDTNAANIRFFLSEDYTNDGYRIIHFPTPKGYGVRIN